MLVHIHQAHSHHGAIGLLLLLGTFIGGGVCHRSKLRSFHDFGAKAREQRPNGVLVSLVDARGKRIDQATFILGDKGGLVLHRHGLLLVARRQAHERPADGSLEIPKILLEVCRIRAKALEGLLVQNVLAERDGVRSSEGFQGNVAEPLLSCSIPELHLTRLALRKDQGGDLEVNTDSADISAFGRRSVNGP